MSKTKVDSLISVRLTIAFLLGLTATSSANELPRKSKTSRESYPNVDVIYDFVEAPHGERRRFALIGKSPSEVTDRLKGAATLYHEWLIQPAATLMLFATCWGSPWPEKVRGHDDEVF